MWSEHCSYKNWSNTSKPCREKAPRLLVGAGEENAGLVDIGDGLGCAFKIESHNHPSAIEPYQGAANRVGGIHRDIFTMGAEPIAALNSLLFWGYFIAPHPKTGQGSSKRYWGLWQLPGVPTIGGEVYFDACYNQNILVNAMSIGTVKKEKRFLPEQMGLATLFSSLGQPPVKMVFMVPHLHLLTLQKIQLKTCLRYRWGDPFQEKPWGGKSWSHPNGVPLWACRDMGAAGITCSTSEMSAKSATGMVIDLDKVPTRQSNMQAFGNSSFRISGEDAHCFAIKVGR